MLRLFGLIGCGMDPGHGNNRSKKDPFSKGLSLQTGGLQQQTECIADLKACWKKFCYFWFHTEVNFFILAYFNAVSIYFYAVKC